MTLTKPKNATKEELQFIKSLEEGLKFVRGQKAKGVIVERHPLRATKEDIKEFRHRLHMSQAQCAMVLEVNIETVKKWEQGKNQIPGPVSLWIRTFKSKPSIVTGLLKEQMKAQIGFS